MSRRTCPWGEMSGSPSQHLCFFHRGSHAQSATQSLSDNLCNPAVGSERFRRNLKTHLIAAIHQCNSDFIT